MSKKTYILGPRLEQFDFSLPDDKPKPITIRVVLGPVDTRMTTRPPCNTCKHEQEKTESQACWECPRPITQYQNYEPK